MPEITAQLVKTLRERTGAGMMDCKTALAECGGDVESSIDWLRQKGHAKMATKADRVAVEGLIAIAIKDNKGAMVELSSETDFVARNEVFGKAAQELAALAINEGENLLQAQMGSSNVENFVKDLAVKLGENIVLKRVKVLEANGDGLLCSYLHNKQSEQTGKIGVLVAMKKGAVETGRQIAMHISAARPLALKKESIPAEIITRERNVLLAQAKEEGKPDDIAKKMVEGRLTKFYKETALLEQEFVLDDDLTIGQLLQAQDADIDDFVCFALGED
jgi:elongation factor Ts